MATTPVPIKRKATTSIRVEVELLTPQFGGSARARVGDPDQWLRWSAVKGALRFWWRALYGHAHADLLKAETSLFGGTVPRPQPSRVEVVVRTTRTTTTAPWAPENGDPLSVAYFSAAGDHTQAAAHLLQPGARAVIQLSLRGLTSQEHEEVVESLRAFLVFGGSGARSRRGAGALGGALDGDITEIGIPSTLESLDAWLRSLPRSHPTRPDYFNLVSPISVFRTATAFPTPSQAHGSVLTLWRDLRQDRPHPGNWRGGTGWGRTAWPEPDLIRTAKGTWAAWASGVSHTPVPAGHPLRPHLGLPIAFPFKDRAVGSIHPIRGRLTRPDPARPDGKPETLTGNPHLPSDQQVKRYASPVLLSVCRLPANPRPLHVGIVLITPSLLSCLVGIDAATTWPLGAWSSVEKRLLSRLTALGSGFVKVV